MPSASDPVFEITAMTCDDLDAVLAIERELFPDPWSERMFRDDLKDDGRRLAVCLRSGGAVAGYAIGWFVADEFHLGNLAVRSRFQGTGLGKKMLGYALDQARSRRCRLATLEVRASNQPAIRLYAGAGFKEIAIRKKYYGTEDALVMLAELGGGDPC
jgi:[ribosomal protein S18]-alanine N-acetyltransferase